jgi:5-methylcytosine-specific restriction enzyme subunit McrC
VLLKLTEHRFSIAYPACVAVQDFQSLEKEYQRYRNIKPRQFPSKRGNDQPCFILHHENQLVHIQANYYIGLDWLIEGVHAVHVLPKINTSLLKEIHKDLSSEEITDVEYDIEKELPVFKELNYLKMFLDAMSHPIIAQETDGLLIIDWQKKEIEIEQEQDALTPFLIIQFLNLLKQIVKKGLKKSYYKQREHLNNRIKGKLLVGSHIKENVLKNRFTKTHCEYQVFGTDNTENQFLKRVLRFVLHYIAEHKSAFGKSKTSLDQIINFCNPAFELITDVLKDEQFRHIKTNPFYSEYRSAIRIGEIILKRFSYNITNTSKKLIKTPPFWIDMPRLFELYVYHHLLSVFNTDEIKYHYKTYGNELDFLIKKSGLNMVIDAKYKLYYKSSAVHNDIRQVSGYARLKKVYKELEMENSKELIDCLIIYPDMVECKENYYLDLSSKTEIKEYQNVYKIGIPLPWIS